MPEVDEFLGWLKRQERTADGKPWALTVDPQAGTLDERANVYLGLIHPDDNLAELAAEVRMSVAADAGMGGVVKKYTVTASLEASAIGTITLKVAPQPTGEPTELQPATPAGLLETAHRRVANVEAFALSALKAASEAMTRSQAVVERIALSNLEELTEHRKRAQDIATQKRLADREEREDQQKHAKEMEGEKRITKIVDVAVEMAPTTIGQMALHFMKRIGGGDEPGADAAAPAVDIEKIAASWMEMSRAAQDAVLSTLSVEQRNKLGALLDAAAAKAAAEEKADEEPPTQH